MNYFETWRRAEEEGVHVKLWNEVFEEDRQIMAYAGDDEEDDDSPGIDYEDDHDSDDVEIEDQNDDSVTWFASEPVGQADNDKLMQEDDETLAESEGHDGFHTNHNHVYWIKSENVCSSIGSGDSHGDTGRYHSSLLIACKSDENYEQTQGRQEKSIQIDENKKATNLASVTKTIDPILSGLFTRHEIVQLAHRLPDIGSSADSPSIKTQAHPKRIPVAGREMVRNRAYKPRRTYASSDESIRTIEGVHALASPHDLSLHKEDPKDICLL